MSDFISFILSDPAQATSRVAVAIWFFRLMVLLIAINGVAVGTFVTNDMIRLVQKVRRHV